MKKINLMTLFNRVVGAVFAVMVAVITLGLIVGVAHLFINLRDLIVEKELTKQYLGIISHVLTLFILIELLRSIVEYFDSKRLRMTFIVDAALVFVLREIMIKLFEHKIEPDEIYAMSVLILVLTILRVGSMLLYQRGAQLGISPPAPPVNERAPSAQQ